MAELEIVRVLSSELPPERLGVELLLENSSAADAWIDQLQLRGEAHQYIRFHAEPFRSDATYYITAHCAVRAQSEDFATLAIEGFARENPEADWAYPATGEMTFRFPSNTGRSWTYSLEFPLIAHVPGHGRAVIRLIFEHPTRVVLSEVSEGPAPVGMYISRTVASCEVRALTNRGEFVTASMDDSILKFISRSPVDRSHSPDTAKPSSAKSLGMTEKTTVLFLAADPSDATHLRIGEEAREIAEKLRLGNYREHFHLQQRFAVRPADITQALLDVDPTIVHFSGHGAADGSLAFESVIGTVQPVEPEALKALFAVSHKVVCVVLNACYSSAQAEAIAEHVRYVVGMTAAISDRAAVAFAIGFYQALASGRTYDDAYALGCVQIRLQGHSGHDLPVLLSNSAGGKGAA